MPLWKAISQYHFNQSLYFCRWVKFNKLILQQLSPNWIISFLKVYKYWCIVPLYVHCFSSNWQTRKILFDLWQHHWHWWPPSVLFTNAVILERRHLPETSYVVDFLLLQFPFLNWISDSIHSDKLFLEIY